MSTELNFEAMPFESYDGFRTLASEQSGFELEEEFGRRSGRGGSSQRLSRGIAKQSQKRPSISSSGGQKKPPVRQPHSPPVRPRWPRRAVFGPYGVVPEPYGAAPEPHPAEPLPADSEYIRWVQSALNDVLSLRLPVHGIADPATRSAIRSFQQREGLPLDGVVGPDTERALLAARSGKSSRGGEPSPAGPDMPEPSGTQTAPAERGASTPPDGEFEFEWENFAEEFDVDDTRKIAERAAVKSRVAAGQTDPNALTDVVFFRRHPERGGRRLGANEHSLAAEWRAILRDVVRPALADASTTPATGTKVSDSDVARALAIAATPVPGMRITLKQLLVRHQAESGGIPIEVLLAFIRFEAGKLFSDATAGKWAEDKTGKLRYVPSPEFYELGVFQTPAGLHGCVPAGDQSPAGLHGCVPVVYKGVKRSCKYCPPGYTVEKSQFGKGWRYFTGTYPTERDWTNPTMQVRIGFWDLKTTGDRVRNDFGDLFPSTRSEWYLRMAVLYSFAAGAGWTRAFLSKYKNELLALPESQRWGFLSGKQASRINPKTKRVETKKFNPKNVDEKMALAAKLRAVPGATITQPMGGPRWPGSKPVGNGLNGFRG